MPIRRRIEKKKGPQGRAEVRVLKDEIKLIDLDTQETHHIDPEDIGEDTVVKAGRNLFYRLSSDGRKLYGLCPFDGQYFIRVKRFLPPPRSEGQTIPGPYVLPGGQDMGGWISRDRSVFNVLLEIVGGEFEGMATASQFGYLFRAGQDDLMELVGGGGKAQKKLEAFLQAAGLDWDKDSIPYSNNVLPELQKVVLKRGVVFFGKFEEGWLQDFTKVPAGMAPPTKKTRKPRVNKAAKKVTGTDVDES